MELSTVHGLLLLVIGVAIMCYSAQYATLLRPTGSNYWLCDAFLNLNNLLLEY